MLAVCRTSDVFSACSFASFWKRSFIFFLLLQSVKDPNVQMATSDKSVIDSLYISESDSTFQYDEQLPSLPLPSLANTLNKYLDTVRPHATEEEFAATEALVREFENGQGKILHEKLAQFASTQKNWLEKWWLDCAYLQLRSPLIPFQNMAGVSPTMDFWPPQPGTRVERASFSMYLNLKFRQMVRQ